MELTQLFQDATDVLFSFSTVNLLQSSNPVYQQLGKITIVPKDYDTLAKMVREDIKGANTHVFLGTLDYVVELDKDEIIPGKYHASTDVLEGLNPYIGDILNKKWSLGEEYTYHLLLFRQSKIKRMFCVVVLH